jgi:hypothetical protein
VKVLENGFFPRPENDRPDNDLLKSFDEYHSFILQKLSTLQNLEHHNFNLQTDYENILQENHSLRKLLHERDVELEQLTKKLLHLFHQILSKSQNLTLEINQQQNFLTLQYDHDILLTNQRNLEKDLMLQRIENERLRNSNNQLLRELQSYQQRK